MDPQQELQFINQLIDLFANARNTQLFDRVAQNVNLLRGWDMQRFNEIKAHHVKVNGYSWTSINYPSTVETEQAKARAALSGFLFDRKRELEAPAPAQTFNDQPAFAAQPASNSMTNTTFDVTVYINRTIANSGSLFNVDGLDVPQGNKSLNLLFVKQLEKQLEELVELEAWKALYNLVVSLQKMTGDRGLYRTIVRPMATAFDDVDKRFISAEEFNETVTDLIESLKVELARIKQQEKEVGKLKEEETLSDWHARLKGTDAMRLEFSDYEALCNAILDRLKTSSMKPAEKTGFRNQFNANVVQPLQRLKSLTGGNFKSRVATLDGVIGRAITKLESEGGFF